MNKKTYYVDDSDWVYCEYEGKLYAYNYVEKTFVLTDIPIDDMTFHEFPEKDLEKYIKLNEYLFK